jgi:membrane protease YdiL (CAAX protease family)
MTAPSDPAPNSPFLAFVGPEDRSLVRVGLWLALGLPLGFLSWVLIGTAAQALVPGLISQLGGGAPLGGPHRLLTEAGYLGVVAFLELALALALTGAARIAFRRQVWTFVTPARRFAPGLLLAGLVVNGLLAGASLGAELLEGQKLIPPILDLAQPQADRIAYALASAPLILLAAAAEEILFRGVLLQVTGAFLKTRIGLCTINGLAFALLHAEPSPVTFLALTLMGAAFAYSVLELGGIEFSLGAHFANNALILLLQEPLSAATKATPFHWSDLAQADTWESLAVSAVISAATAAAAHLIARRRRLRL